MRTLRNSLPALLAVVVVGCASTGGTGASDTGRSITSRPGQQQATAATATTRTPSGKPEVVIPGTTKKAVVDALASQMTRQGYSVGRIDDYRAQFEKPGGFWLDLLMGSKFNSSAIWRISYTLFDSPEGVRVIADMGAVTNPGSGFEKITEVKGGKNAAAVQSILDAVKNETGRTPIPQASQADSTAQR